jgi:hypothetical protein
MVMNEEKPINKMTMVDVRYSRIRYSNGTSIECIVGEHNKQRYILEKPPMMEV